VMKTLLKNVFKKGGGKQPGDLGKGGGGKIHQKELPGLMTSLGKIRGGKKKRGCKQNQKGQAEGQKKKNGEKPLLESASVKKRGSGGGLESRMAEERKFKRRTLNKEGRLAKK